MKAITGILGKITPILKIIGSVLQTVMLISVFVMNLLMVYIMFAPDDLPKPFYLSYAGQGNTTVIVPATGPGLSAPTPKASASQAGTAATPDPSIPGNGKMIDTGSKIVNLADPGGRRYLRVSVVLEVTPPPEVLAAMNATPAKGAADTTVNPLITDFNDAINKKMPVINDTITTVLSSKTFESIYTADGKEALREEIKQKLNERLPELAVISIYFTEFVVQ